jgi:hypothetical protein
MEIVEEYTPQVEKWEHEKNQEKWLAITSPSLFYHLGITTFDPNDPECVYFNVGIEHCHNNSINGNVFYSMTHFCIKVRNKNRVPSVEFYFSLILKCSAKFAIIFHDKTKDTNLLHHKIPVPLQKNLRAEIQNSIDIWDMTTRNNSLN